jgi:hypothetical protein
MYVLPFRHSIHWYKSAVSCVYTYSKLHTFTVSTCSKYVMWYINNVSILVVSSSSACLYTAPNSNHSHNLIWARWFLSTLISISGKKLNFQVDTRSLVLCTVLGKKVVLVTKCIYLGWLVFLWVLTILTQHQCLRATLRNKVGRW